MTSAQLRETVQEREKVCVREREERKLGDGHDDDDDVDDGGGVRAFSTVKNGDKASVRSRLRFSGRRPDFKSAGCLPSRPKCLPSKKGYAENLPHYPVNIHCKEDLAGNPD